MGNVDLTMLNVKHGYNLQLAHKAHNQEILPNARYLVRAQDDEEGLYVSWAGVPSTTDPSAWAVEPAFFEFESLFLSLNPDVSTSINGRMLRQTAVGCLLTEQLTQPRKVLAGLARYGVWGSRMLSSSAPGLTTPLGSLWNRQPMARVQPSKCTTAPAQRAVGAT